MGRRQLVVKRKGSSRSFRSERPVIGWCLASDGTGINAFHGAQLSFVLLRFGTVSDQVPDAIPDHQHHRADVDRNDYCGNKVW